MRPLDWLGRFLDFTAPRVRRERLDDLRRRAFMGDEAAREQEQVLDGLGAFAAMAPHSTLLTVSAEMGELLTTAAASFPQNIPFRIGELPWTRCLCIFDRPVRLEWCGDTLSCAAVQWYSHSWSGRKFELEMHGQKVPAISARWYVNQDEAGWPPLPTLDADWPDGSAAFINDADTPPERVLERLYLIALWTLVQQRIAVCSTSNVDRGERRRWASQRTDPIPETLTVTLRRTGTFETADEGAGLSVDWSHRWMVDGHWREQWYPSVGEHRPIWIAPHVKGPDDKPLVMKHKIYAWTR